MGTDGMAAAKGGGVVEGTTTEGTFEGVLESVWGGHWPNLALPPRAFIIIGTGKEAFDPAPGARARIAI